MMNLSSLSFAKILNGLAFASCLVLGIFILLAESINAEVAYAGIALIAGCQLTGLIKIRKVQSEIGRMNTTVLSLSKGNFEARLTGITEKGQIGEFQWSLNHMIDAVDSFIRESTAAMEYVSRNQYFRRILEPGMHGNLLIGARIINQAAQNVEDKMNEFQSIADDLNESLTLVVQQINTTAATLESSTETMKDAVALTTKGSGSAMKNSDNASMSVQTISAAAEEMSSCIAEITQQMSKTSLISKNAVEESTTASETIRELSHMADQISIVIRMIQDIADQTNLLALNATIEAARAGESGKGFAVVASEVKNLAGQTGKATEEISNLVSSIQAATGRVVIVFKSIGSVIAEVDQAATTVAAAIEEQSAASKEIASSAERASGGTNSVAENIRDINKSMMDLEYVTDKVVSVTGDLSQNVVANVRTLLQRMDTFMVELKKIA